MIGIREDTRLIIWKLRETSLFPFYMGYLFSPLMTEQFRLEMPMDKRPQVVAPLMENRIQAMQARYHSWLIGKAWC